MNNNYDIIVVNEPIIDEEMIDYGDWEVVASDREEDWEVWDALRRTRQLQGKEGSGVPAGYYNKMIEQRLPKTGAGSVFNGFSTPEKLDRALNNAHWDRAYNPNVAPGCDAYVTRDIPGGQYGMVPVAEQPDDTVFHIEDRKNTGKVSLVLHAGKRIPAAETWLIIGPADNGEKVVYTFHPGEPVPRATTSTEKLPVGTTLTKQQALDLGFNLAKVEICETRIKQRRSKMNITMAISHIAFTMSDAYNLYLYCLDDKEEFEEKCNTKKAWKTLKANGLDVKAIEKHIARHKNIVPEPMRFIDRHPFRKVDANELPF